MILGWNDGVVSMSWVAGERQRRMREEIPRGFFWIVVPHTAWGDWLTDWLTNWLTDWHLSGRIENVLHFVLGLLWDGGGKQKLQEYPAHTVVPGGGNTQIRNVCYWITKRCHRSARGRVQQWWIKPPTNERWSSQAAVVWCVKVFSGYKEWQIVLLIAHIYSYAAQLYMALSLSFISSEVGCYIRGECAMWHNNMYVYIYSGYWSVIILLSSSPVTISSSRLKSSSSNSQQSG